MAKSDRISVNIEQLTLSNSLQLTALVQLLEEKGLVTKEEVLGRVKRLQEPSWKPD